MKAFIKIFAVVFLITATTGCDKTEQNRRINNLEQSILGLHRHIDRQEAALQSLLNSWHYTVTLNQEDLSVPQVNTPMGPLFLQIHSVKETKEGQRFIYTIINPHNFDINKLGLKVTWGDDELRETRLIALKGVESLKSSRGEFTVPEVAPELFKNVQFTFAPLQISVKYTE